MRKAMLLLAVLGLAGSLWGADPFVGTWKMNLAKSKFSYPPPKSYAITVQSQENGIRAVQDIVDADGKVTHRILTAKYDGKNYHVTALDADSISLTKPDANTTEYVFKKSGKEVWSGRAVVSKDGKTCTDTGGGRDAKGQALTYSFLLEKQ